MSITESSRHCPDCNVLLTYSNKYECNRAKKKQKVCYACRTQRLLKDPEYLRKLNEGVRKFQAEYKRRGIKRKCSDAKKEKLRKNAKCLYGTDNSRYGKSLYCCWLEKYGKKMADEKMVETKRKWSAAASGENNPMYGKPSPQGSGNGWSGWYNGWYFRSLHELSYMINVIEKNGWRWENAEQKKYAIPYTNWEGMTRTYFADFLVNGNLLVECKPTRLHNSITVNSKRAGAMTFCAKNNLTYRVECPILLTNDEIENLHDNGEIKFLPRYEEKYSRIYNTKKL